MQLPASGPGLMKACPSGKRLSPHRVLGVDENDELIDGYKQDDPAYGAKKTFPEMILDSLRIAGVQQAHKEDRIIFTALTLWPGDLVCAEGRYLEGETEKRAAIFIGPEFGTVQRADLVAAAREAGDAGFDVLIACAFNYEAHTTEFTKLGRRAVHLARTHPNARVLLTTFSDTLASALRTKLKRLLSAEPRLAERIDVYSLNAIGLRLYKAHVGLATIADRKIISELIREAASAVGGHKFGQHFLLTEWEQVVDAWQLGNWEAY